MTSSGPRTFYLNEGDWKGIFKFHDDKENPFYHIVIRTVGDSSDNGSEQNLFFKTFAKRLNSCYLEKAKKLFVSPQMETILAECVESLYDFGTNSLYSKFQEAMQQEPSNESWELKFVEEEGLVPHWQLKQKGQPYYLSQHLIPPEKMSDPLYEQVFRSREFGNEFKKIGPKNFNYPPEMLQILEKMVQDKIKEQPVLQNDCWVVIRLLEKDLPWCRWRVFKIPKSDEIDTPEKANQVIEDKGNKFADFVLCLCDFYNSSESRFELAKKYFQKPEVGQKILDFYLKGYQSIKQEIGPELQSFVEDCEGKMERQHNMNEDSIPENISFVQDGYTVEYDGDSWGIFDQSGKLMPLGAVGVTFVDNYVMPNEKEMRPIFESREFGEAFLKAWQDWKKDGARSAYDRMSEWLQEKSKNRIQALWSRVEELHIKYDDLRRFMNYEWKNQPTNKLRDPGGLGVSIGTLENILKNFQDSNYAQDELKTIENVISTIEKHYQIDLARLDSWLRKEMKALELHPGNGIALKHIKNNLALAYEIEDQLQQINKDIPRDLIDLTNSMQEKLSSSEKFLSPLFWENYFREKATKYKEFAKKHSEKFEQEFQRAIEKDLHVADTLAEWLRDNYREKLIVNLENCRAEYDFKTQVWSRYQNESYQRSGFLSDSFDTFISRVSLLKNDDYQKCLKIYESKEFGEQYLREFSLKNGQKDSSWLRIWLLWKNESGKSLPAVSNSVHSLITEIEKWRESEIERSIWEDLCNEMFRVCESWYLKDKIFHSTEIDKVNELLEKSRALWNEKRPKSLVEAGEAGVGFKKEEFLDKLGKLIAEANALKDSCQKTLDKDGTKNKEKLTAILVDLSPIEQLLPAAVQTFENANYGSENDLKHLQDFLNDTENGLERLQSRYKEHILSNLNLIQPSLKGKVQEQIAWWGDQDSRWFSTPDVIKVTDYLIHVGQAFKNKTENKKMIEGVEMTLEEHAQKAISQSNELRSYLAGAETVQDFIIKNKLNSNEIDKLVENGVNPKAVELWKQVYGQKKVEQLPHTYEKVVIKVDGKEIGQVQRLEPLTLEQVIAEKDKRIHEALEKIIKELHVWDRFPAAKNEEAVLNLKELFDLAHKPLLFDRVITFNNREKPLNEHIEEAIRNSKLRFGYLHVDEKYDLDELDEFTIKGALFREVDYWKGVDESKREYLWNLALEPAVNQIPAILFSRQARRKPKEESSVDKIQRELDRWANVEIATSNPDISKLIEDLHAINVQSPNFEDRAKNLVARSQYFWGKYCILDNQTLESLSEKEISGLLSKEIDYWNNFSFIESQKIKDSIVSVSYSWNEKKFICNERLVNHYKIVAFDTIEWSKKLRKQIADNPAFYNLEVGFKIANALNRLKKTDEYGSDWKWLDINSNIIQLQAIAESSIQPSSGIIKFTNDQIEWLRKNSEWWYNDLRTSVENWVNQKIEEYRKTEVSHQHLEYFLLYVKDLCSIQQKETIERMIKEEKERFNQRQAEEEKPKDHFSNNLSSALYRTTARQIPTLFSNFLLNSLQDKLPETQAQALRALFGTEEGRAILFGMLGYLVPNLYPDSPQTLNRLCQEMRIESLTLGLDKILEGCKDLLQEAFKAQSPSIQPLTFHSQKVIAEGEEVILESGHAQASSNLVAV